MEKGLLNSPRPDGILFLQRGLDLAQGLILSGPKSPARLVALHQVAEPRPPSRGATAHKIG